MENMAIGDILRINTNIGALNSLNSLNSLRATNSRIALTQLRLASGRRITQVSDDSSGFVISIKLNARNKELSVAIENVATAKNVLAIAEGGLKSIAGIIILIKDKVTQSLNDTNGESELIAIGTEISQLRAEINDIVDETSFNGILLLDGSYTGITFQTGEQVGDTLNFDLFQEHTTDELDLNPPGGPPPGKGPPAGKGPPSGKGFTKNELGIPDLDKVNDALNNVLNSLQKVGSFVSRLTLKENMLNTALVNTRATLSRILDADLVNNQLLLIKDFILQQTSTAQLASANLQPQSVLALFL